MSLFKTVTVVLFFIGLFILTACSRAYGSQVIPYPDNYRHSREMVFDPDHQRTPESSDLDMYQFFFDGDYVFKEIKNPREIPKDHKKEFKDPMTFWEIIADRIKPENVFMFSPLNEQSNTPQRLVKAVAMGVLFDQDRKIYHDMETGMRVSPFWKNNGATLTLWGDGMLEVAASSLLYVVGGKKNREVSQMLMEAAMSLRVFYIKRVIGYTRPSEHNASIGLHSNYDSFPSGHTAVAFSMSTILGEAYDIKWITYPLAVLAGLSRLQQNTHWPSDVFAGAFLGHAEAREILARHNYLPTDKYAESHAWDNTRVDIETGLRVFQDSYINMERRDPVAGKVGRVTWRWRIAQKLSDDALLQVNYHWRGLTPGDASYNAVEDVLINPRLAFRVGKNTALVGEYTYNKVQFDDLARTHHNDRAIIPDDLNYAKRFIENRATLGMIFNLAPGCYIKPSYSFNRNIYSGFTPLNSRGGTFRLDGRFTLGKQGKTAVNIGGETGRENADNHRLSNSFQSGNISLDYKLNSRSTLRGQFIASRKKFHNWTGSPVSNWQVAGAEFSHQFHPTWQLDAGYFRRRLKSGVALWPYSKNQYYLDTSYRF